jgi:peroxiredoxin
MKERLEVAANILVIIVACIIGSYFLKERFAPPKPLASSLKAGDHLAGLSAYDWKAHDRTLVLALRKGCHFCEDSMPFYRKLANLEELNRIDAHVVAVFPDDAPTVQQLVQKEQLPVQALPAVALDQMKVQGTPTLILVDQQGRVSKVWEGQLAAPGEEEVISAISKAPVAELTRRELAASTH